MEPAHCAVWWATPNLEDFSYRSIIRSHIYISAHPSRAWFISSLVNCCKESGSDSKLPLLIKISRDLKITKQLITSSFILQRFQHLYTSDTSEFPQTVDMTGYRGPFSFDLCTRKCLGDTCAFFLNILPTCDCSCKRDR